MEKKKVPISKDDIYDEIIKKYATKFLLDWLKIKAQIKVESDFIFSAKSKVGAIGLMQIMPKTNEWLNNIDKERKIKEEELFEPDNNIYRGCFYMHWLMNKLNKYNDNEKYVWELALASYNCGLGNVQKAINKYLEKNKNALNIFWNDIKNYLPSETMSEASKKQVIDYVAKIKKVYEEYKRKYNV